MLKFVIAAFLVVCVNSFAVTNQFRGVNWADKRDNFVSDVLVLSGLSLSDTYESASVVADRVIGQFVEVLGTNSVRIPINEPTASKYWNTYKAVIDVGTSYGRVDIGYWGPAQPSGPNNMDDWWKMWKTVVDDYGEDPNVYFEIFNEPHMYSKNDLRNLYATWLEKFPNVPRDHIILDGTGMAQNVPEIAEDSRFDECLFAVHEYTFWNMSITTESGWKNSFKGKVGNFIDRTICTEWGGAMSPGDKAGVHYEYMDYNTNPTNYFMAYIRGMSDQLREWEMGSFYWPGLRDGDWYSMTVREGEGANIKLTIPNQSGLDRLHMAWSDTVETTPVVQEPFGDAPVELPGIVQAENYDKGGNRHSFYDKDGKNQGGVYREDAVDIVQMDSLDASKGFAVGYTEAGEWLEYTVDVKNAGEFTVKAAFATASENAGVQLFVDDKAVSDSVIATQGEDWSTYVIETFKTSKIEAGEHVLKMVILGNYLNVDYLEFCAGACAAIDSAKSAVEPVDSPDSNTAAVASVRSFVSSNGVVKVFGVTGKFLGNVPLAGESASEALKQFGYASGTYVVRFGNGKTSRVKISR